MKIVCDNCATKYQIADEKVSGKAFKIRCKKCGHVIVVGKNDGSTGAAAGDAPAESAAAAPEPAAGESVWHLVIDREQVGPMTAEEVRAKVKAGQVNADTYGWKEGFEDWLKLSAIDVFKEIFAGATSEPATQRNESPEPQQADQAAPTPGSDAVAGIAAQEPVKTAAPTAATLYSEGGNDARAQLQAAQAAREAQMAAQAAQQVAQQAAPAVDAGGGGSVGGMTGARSENSVLFSLNNLSALAGGGGGSGGGQASSQQAGYGSGQSEASGLIDIRAMAAQHLGGPMGSAHANKAPDLFGGPDIAPVFAPVAPAVLVPTAQSEGTPKWVWGLVGVGGAMIVGLIALLVVVLSADTPKPIAQNPTNAGTSTTQVGGGTTPNPGTTISTTPSETKATKPESSGKTDTSAKADTPTKEGSSPKSSGKSSGKSEKGKAAAQPKEAAPPPEKAGPGKAPDEAPPPPKKAAEKPKAAKDDLDSLLDSASSGSGGKPQKAEKKDLPENLDRGVIMSTLKSANFSSCKAEGASGVVSVKLTIGRNGKVSDASGPNDCVVRIVKGVKFPEFSGDPMTLTYPALIR